MPPIAHDKTEQGSVAFTRYYYALLAYAHVTGEWIQLKELSLPDCTECAEFWSTDRRRFPDKYGIWPSRGTRDTLGIRSNRTTPVITVYAGPARPGQPTKFKYYPDDFVGWSDAVTLVYSSNGWRVQNIEVTQIEY